MHFQRGMSGSTGTTWDYKKYFFLFSLSEAISLFFRLKSNSNAECLQCFSMFVFFCASYPFKASLENLTRDCCGYR